VCVVGRRPVGVEGRKSEVCFVLRLGVIGREGPASSVLNLSDFELSI